MAEEIINPEFKINPNILPTNPLEIVETDIRTKAQSLNWNENRQLENMSASSFFAPFEDNRIKTQDFIIDPREVYTELSSGEFSSRYPSYIRGIDNEEYHAERQGAGEKWANGLIKFGGKTLNAVVGGTVGTVYGVGSWISNGSFESVYNNDFSNWLADLDVKMNNNLANYYTKQEQEKGVFGQMGTANFWSDKVLGGLSFTAGAIVSEGIWAWATGGASLATTATRWGARSLGMQRLAKAVSKTKELVKSPFRNSIVSPAGNVAGAIQAGNIAGRTVEGLNTLRFAMTSAGYEASVEALQFRREQEENFLYSFQQINGRMPNADEVAEFKANLETASNAVFATNMAIVGSSNLVTLGNIFKIKSPVNTGLKDFVNKTVYGVGTADDALKRIHRINRKALPLVKNMITEGLYEEGSQSMTTNIADQWMKYTYDENRIGESFDMSGALYEAFAEQYGTTEGWKENLVGMIIGAIGEAGTGNSRADLKKEIQTAEQRQAMAKTFTSEALSKKFLAASQIANFNQQAEKAEAQGNLTEARIAQDGAIISYLTNRHELGDSNTEIIKDVQASLETVKQEDLAELGINQDLQEWKQQQLEAFTQVVGMFSSTREFAERLVGRGQVQGLDATKLDGLGDINQQELAIQAITFSLMAGHRADAIMKEASQAVGEMFGAESGLVLTTVEELSKAQSKTRGTIALLTNHIKNYTAQADKLRQQILDETAKAENKTGDEVKGDKISELSTKLINLEQKIATEQQKLEEVARNLNIAKSSSNQAQSALFPTIDNINIISAEDLLNLDENINTLQQSVNQLREVNPEAATRAENILKEFNSAKNAWKSHKATVDMIIQGKINLPSVNTRLGALMKKGATIDEANKQWLTEVLQDYANRVFNNLYEQAGTIKQEATQETVLNKLRKNESLTKEEQELYDQNKEAIDGLLKQEPALPVDQSQRIAELKEELETLRDYTPTSQTETGVSQSTPSLQETERRRREELNNESTFQLIPSNIQESGNLIYVATPSPDGSFNTSAEHSQAQVGRTYYVLNIDKNNTERATLDFVNSEYSAGAASNYPQTYLYPVADAQNAQAVSTKITFVEKPIMRKSGDKWVLEKKGKYFYGKIVKNNNIDSEKINAKYDAEYIDAVKKGEMTKEQAMQALEEVGRKDSSAYAEIGALEGTSTVSGKVVQTPSPQNQQRIEQLEKEIERLERIQKNIPQEPKPLSQLDYLKQRYEEVKKGTLALSEPVDNPESPRPSNEELEEFKGLYEKQLQEPLTGEETLRYEELLQSIQEWRLVGSFIDNGSGMSLADLIELIAQHEQQEAVEETKSTFTPQDVENATSNIDEFGRKDDHSLGQNVTASVTVRKDKDTGKITVHHLNPLSIAGNNFTVKRGNKTLTNPKTIEIDDVVTTESGVTFKVIAGRNLEFNKIDDLTNLGLVIVNSGVQWSFSDIYYDNGSELVKRPSDLTEPSLQPEYAFEVKQGQEVRFEIDRNDEYTKQLLDKYNKSKKEEDLKALQDGIKVYIVIDGKKVNTLKAQRGVSDENVTALRQQAAEVALQDEFTNDIGAKTTVLNTFLGSPQLILQTVERENGTVDVQVATKPVTQTATENIITKGYIQNGELTLSEEVRGDVNTMYVSKMSRTPENQNSKIPVVVVKRGVNYLALPIKMTQVPLADSTIEEELSTISVAESEIEVAKAINNIIIKYSLPLDKVIPNNAVESVEKLEEELRKHTTSVSAERVAQKDYNKSNLQADAEMYIDIDNLNEVIKDAKVRIDITNIEFEDGTGIQNMSKENLETEMDNILAQMRSKMYTAPVSQTEQLEDFFQPFNDNLEVVGEEITPQTKFEVLKEMFNKTLKPAEKNFFGNEIVSKAKAIVDAYENILKQVTPNSSLKKSGKNNTKC